MADLDVQPKKKSTMTWIIVAIVVLAILLLLYRTLDGNEEQATSPRDTVAARGIY